MARLFTTGFELGSTTAGIEGDTYSGVTLGAGYARSGGYGLRVAAAGTTPYWRTKVYAADSSTAICYLRFYFYISSTSNATTQIARILNASNVQQAVLQITSGATPVMQMMNASVVQVGNNSATLSTGTWYRVEMSWNPATGAQTAYIDGTSFATGSGSTGSWSQILLGVPAGTPTCEFWYDDVAINDNSGAAQTGLPGSGKVIVLKPDSAGDVNTFTAVVAGGTAGAANNYTRVQEVTPDDTSTYQGSGVLNDEDMFNCEASGVGASDTVNVVHVGIRGRNGVGADATTAIKTQIKKTASGTIAQGAALIPNSTTWTCNQAAAPKTHNLTTYADPDGAAWTSTTLDSMQIGYKITAANTRRIDVTKVWAVVDYTPASGVSASATQVAATMSFSRGTQDVASVAIQNVAQTSQALNLSGGTQQAAGITVQSASVAQVAANMVLTAGTQVVEALVKLTAAVTQVAANLTLSAGTASVAAVVIASASVSQVGATLSLSGGTQSVAAVSYSAASVTQVGKVLTLSGGTQVVVAEQEANVIQVRQALTLTPGTQTLSAVQIASVAQTAATMIATAGTQVVGSTQIASVTQTASTLTISGGTQVVSGSAATNASATQTAGTITIAGGTQQVDGIVVASASVNQVAGTITLTGGTQEAVGGVGETIVTQVGATITATGGTQSVLAFVPSGTYPKFIYVDGKLAIHITGKHYTKV